ncbi:hypothetical protein GUJ93_ZPchr0013g36641 [Zizania palustris]|uniref:Obtusifoliol 14-alpha demethylase n=1 Tax=Zizania palustris TaxID=103762 RepID=A0A8J5WY08_ZIZPA|nr:hypothetical protein GUJ93_ZPchr0013g36641 [Zizania palustris]
MDDPTNGGGGAMWLTAVAVMLTIAVVTRRRERKSSNRAAATGRAAAPPELRGAALLWCALSALRDGPLEAFRRQHAKLGSVFTASLPGLVKLTFLVGPEASRYFYLAPETEISHGRIYEFTIPLFGRGVGYDVDLATRSEQTRFYLDALHARKVRASIAAMVEEVEDYFSRWGEAGVVDLKHEMEHALLLISSRCLLGREVRESMVDEVCTLFRDLADGLQFISLFLPYLPTPAHRRRDRARVRLTELFTKVIRSRKSSGAPTSAAEDDDMLQRLINSRYKDGRATTEAEVAALLLAVVFAGKHTSYITSTWTGIHLLSDSDPTHLAAAIDEQDQLTARHHGARVDYANVVQEMTTLHRCIKETVRLHPASPALARRVRKNLAVRTKEGDEYVIPEGHTVMSTVLVNHHLHHIYKNPHVYDPPGRFGPGREEDNLAGAFSYLGFSAGRHVCLGETFAYTQIKVLWSHLLKNFDLKMVSPFPKTKLSTMVAEPKGKVMVSYRRRRQGHA